MLSSLPPSLPHISGERLQEEQGPGQVVRPPGQQVVRLPVDERGVVDDALSGGVHGEGAGRQQSAALQNLADHAVPAAGRLLDAPHTVPRRPDHVPAGRAARWGCDLMAVREGREQGDLAVMQGVLTRSSIADHGAAVCVFL